MSYRNVLEKASAKAIEFYESLDTRSPCGRDRKLRGVVFNC